MWEFLKRKEKGIPKSPRPKPMPPGVLPARRDPPVCPAIYDPDLDERIDNPNTDTERFRHLDLSKEYQEVLEKEKAPPPKSEIFFHSLVDAGVVKL